MKATGKATDVARDVYEIPIYKSTKTKPLLATKSTRPKVQTVVER